MTVQTTYRTCPRSGLQFEKQAEALMKINAVTAVVALLVGGLLAIGVVLTRWPAVHWLAADTFYMVLTAHGIDMLIFWIIFFEVAVLYFASSTLLRCRLATPKIAWAAYALMLIGAIVNNVSVFQGSSSVMMTSYVPMMAHWSFYLGLILFAVGALIACFVFFGTLVVAKREKTYQGSVPLVTFGAITAAIIAVFTISSGAIILIPTFLMSIGLINEVDPLIYRTSGGPSVTRRSRSTWPPTSRSGTPWPPSPLAPSPASAPSRSRGSSASASTISAAPPTWVTASSCWAWRR